MKVRRRLQFHMDGQAGSDLYAELADISRKLDEMLAAVSQGLRGAAQFNELEEQASAIGAQLRAAFRNGKMR